MIDVYQKKIDADSKKLERYQPFGAGDSSASDTSMESQLIGSAPGDYKFSDGSVVTWDGTKIVETK